MSTSYDHRVLSGPESSRTTWVKHGLIHRIRAWFKEERGGVTCNEGVLPFVGELRVAAFMRTVLLVPGKSIPNRSNEEATERDC